MESKVISMDLSDLMGDRFGEYSKYIILQRAIPDVRDGLKPVQRRILYAMYDAGNTPDKPYRKSVKSVGDVLANYHPHGDAPAYGAMVTLAQQHKMLQPLIDGHGNWGSLDDDAAAAMRYTEARLSNYAMMLLMDIKKNSVPFRDNYDNTTKEPEVLPARLPNLLINGGAGIASGFSTTIPPHNPKDVVSACVEYLGNPDVSIERLIDIVQAPDFPTGCLVQDTNAIREMYRTGKGTFAMSARVQVEKPTKGNPYLVFSHIPYNTVKSKIVQEIAEIGLNKDIDGIVEVRDETGKDHGRVGARIVVELKKSLSDSQVDQIIAFLYKKTQLMSHFSGNFTAIKDGRPERLNLKEIIAAYVAHQKAVVTARTRHDLEKAMERLHVVEGYLIGLGNIDQVIQIIKESKSRKHANERLVAEIGVSEIQANAILDLQLYRITSLEAGAIEKERKELQRKIKDMNEILSSPKALNNTVSTELQEAVSDYIRERYSPIQEEKHSLDIEISMTIPDEETYVVLTKNGFIKRVNKKSYAGISGIDAVNLKSEDYITSIVKARTTDTLLFFNSRGMYYSILTYKIPEGKWKDEGSPIFSTVPISQDESIVEILSIDTFEQETDLCTVTKNGIVKRTSLKEYKTDRSVAVKGVQVREEDELTGVFLLRAEDNILFITKSGLGGIVDKNEVSVTGRASTGVKLAQLSDGDTLLTAMPTKDLEQINVVTSRLEDKKIKVKSLEVMKRGSKGSKLYKARKNESIVGFYKSSDYEPICVVDTGKMVSLEQGLAPETSLMAVYNFPKNE